MKIKLSENSPVSMLFIGEPKNLVASLTFANPGPVDLDFDTLSRQQQLKVLNALKQGVVETDTPFQDLYDKWNLSQPKSPPEDKPVPQTDTPVVKDPSKAEERMALEKERADKEQKLFERCSLLLKQNTKVIQAELLGEEDTRFIRNLLQMESANKQRKIVLSFLQEKLVKIEAKIAKKISKDVAEQVAYTPRKYHEPTDFETKGYTVVESEQKTVVLSPNELIRRTLQR